MPHPEREIEVVTCTKCGGNGRCSACDGDKEKIKNCPSCFAGKCSRCGGSGWEVQQRRVLF